MTQAAAGLHESCLTELRAGAANSQLSPLFLFPDVAGDPESFQALAERLGAARPIYAFRHIGARFESEPVRQVSRLAQLYAADLRRAAPHGPYYLCGHAMGGAVAFEVARELDSQGQKVGLVIMVDCLAPRYLQPLAAWQHARSSFQRLLETRERAARTSKQRRRVEAALHEAYDHYRPSPQCVDVLFLTAEAPHGLPPYPDPLLGWGNFLRGRISQCGVTGARARIFAPENLTQLTTRITAALKSAERNRENGVKLAAV